MNAPLLNNPQTALIRLEQVSYQVKDPAATTQGGFDGWLHRLISNSSKKGGVEQPNRKTLLQDITLTLMPNEMISIIGPNGAGKSTLIKLMLGMLSPSSGHITRAPALRTGYVPQRFAVPMMLPLRVCDLLAQVDSALNDIQRQQLYERLHIPSLLSSQVASLSGGETQRVLLARSLLSRPDLLVLDEPMQGLDPQTELDLYAFLDDLPEFLRCAMVVVSHDLHWVMRGTRRVICLNKHICCEGRPAELTDMATFWQLFGHQYQQPYLHQPHHCEHSA